VESDHQDYYPTYESIRDAFLEYAALLPSGGELIYCADDPGASEVAHKAEAAALVLNRPIRIIPYGFTVPSGAQSPFRIETYRVENERQVFTVAGFPGELRLRVPGRHVVLDAVAALVLTDSLLHAEFGAKYDDSNTVASALAPARPGWTAERWENTRKALEEFRGSKRRSEILGESKGVLFMDDYGHHPTAVQTTLAGLKEFYPGRRLILSFMSHTYTRTAALLDEFAASFAKADIVFLHKIYASARELYSGGVNGRTLYEKTVSLRSAAARDTVYYVEEHEDAAGQIAALLRPGDLFVTMGAGDNWKLGRKLFGYYKGENAL
jgi:UDP-N-acetylmuramate--alanine ligase